MYEYCSTCTQLSTRTRAGYGRSSYLRAHKYEHHVRRTIRSIRLCCAHSLLLSSHAGRRQGGFCNSRQHDKKSCWLDSRQHDEEAVGNSRQLVVHTRALHGVIARVARPNAAAWNAATEHTTPEPCEATHTPITPIPAARLHPWHQDHDQPEARCARCTNLVAD